MGDLDTTIKEAMGHLRKAKKIVEASAVPGMDKDTAAYMQAKADAERAQAGRLFERVAVMCGQVPAVKP